MRQRLSHLCTDAREDKRRVCVSRARLDAVNNGAAGADATDRPLLSRNAVFLRLMTRIAIVH